MLKIKGQKDLRYDKLFRSHTDYMKEPANRVMLGRQIHDIL